MEVGPANLLALTEGIHTREALELVREHLLGVMGPAASTKFSSELIKMSKFQMAQVYAASVMFGYFLRRVDKRFQLEKALGMLVGPEAQDDAVARLERLFSEADDSETTQDPDSPPPSYTVYEVSSDDQAESGGSETTSKADDDTATSDTTSSSSSTSSSSAGFEAGTSSGGLSPGFGARGSLKRQKSALRSYVEGFDQATMVETARVVSAEGAGVVERQTTALFGDIKALTQQMQAALGGGVSSAEELYMKIQQVCYRAS